VAFTAPIFKELVNTQYLFVFGSSLTNIIQTERIFGNMGKFCTILNKVKGKGKAIPLQAWTDPEGSRRVRLPDFKTVGT